MGFFLMDKNITKKCSIGLGNFRDKRAVRFYKVSLAAEIMI